MSKEDKPVKVLHILQGDENHSYGGVEAFLYEYYKRMNQNGSSANGSTGGLTATFLPQATDVRNDHTSCA